MKYQHLWWHAVGRNVQKQKAPKTTLVMRAINTGSRRTSVRLEPELWHALDALAAVEGKTVNEICMSLDRTRAGGGLTSALRVYIVTHLASTGPIRDCPAG